MKSILAAVVLLSSGFAASADQFVLKLETSFSEIPPRMAETLRVSEVERFEADGVNFVILDAENEAYLDSFLFAKKLVPLAVSKVGFVNSPVVGGGEAASLTATERHKTFVIERPIPGVGGFPVAKKEGISRASNAAIAQLSDSVEWVHSYLTDGGTYCVYRATDEGKIVEHANLAGAPLGPITLVERVVAD